MPNRPSHTTILRAIHRQECMAADRVLATYLIETPLPIEQAAAVLAGDQSGGTFVAVPGETAELKEKYSARVETIEELEPAAAPSLPGSRSPKGATPVYRRAKLTVSWPVANFGYNLPALVSTI